MTQRVLIVEELDQKSAANLYGAVGHYYKLACAYSTPTSADALYARARKEQMESFQRAASECRVDPACISRFVTKLEGELLMCAAEQKQRSDDIAKVTRVVNAGCDIEVK
jgi:hypothetical protein